MSNRTLIPTNKITAANVPTIRVSVIHKSFEQRKHYCLRVASIQSRIAGPKNFVENSKIFLGVLRWLLNPNVMQQQLRYVCVTGGENLSLERTPGL